jgi:UPF0042 nucleotide-binding protein
MTDDLEIIIVTGLSGSGKSVAIRALEDNGFFCIDNLPAPLIPKFIDLCVGYSEGISRIALGVDLRAGQFLQSLPQVLADMRRAGHHVQMLFFDASDEVLLRRFSETRRPHPLAGEEPIQEGILRERKALEAMRESADKVIDTSNLNVHELEFTLPLYEREGKSSLTVALGCTGGRHRSVVLVEELHKRLAAGKFRIHVKHRDIEK